MVLKKIKLTFFRNFEKKTFEIHPLLSIVIGENSRGKTNLLEGIYFLINGVGFRESKEEELINFDNPAYCSIEGSFSSDKEQYTFAITILKWVSGVLSKSFFINKTKKRPKEYLASQIKTVLFAPEQIEIIIGPPQKRREYINKLISSYDPEYKATLNNYEGALRKRNKILEGRMNLDLLKKQLVFWNKYLEEQGSYLTRKREEYINYLNSHPHIDQKLFSIVYLKSDITQEKLEASIELESKIGRTLIGPQKDDFEIYLTDKNIHHFGSRSEQRLSILWLKINELNFYEKKFKHKPVLLLDDIFSEFDKKNKKLILGLIKKYQTILTTTEEDILSVIKVPSSIIRL